MRNQEGIKIELQKKVRRRIRVRDITFLTARPPFYITLCCFLRLLPRLFLSDALDEWPQQRYMVLLWVAFCVML